MSMRLISRSLVLVLIVASIQAGKGNNAIAESQITLAYDHPYASLFMQMARRAAADYSARYMAFAPSIQAMVDEGYTAYLFPAGSNLSYDIYGDKVVITSNGMDSFTLGQVTPSYDVGVRLVDGSLFELVELPKHEIVDGEAVYVGTETYHVWNFRGAEWLDQGYSWSEVESALRLDRIATHLAWAGGDYVAVYGAPPINLAELEAFVGTARNAPCWQDVQIVDDIYAVDYSPMSLFAGWDGGEWIIKANVGPELLMTRFYLSDEGDWRRDPAGMAY